MDTKKSRRVKIEDDFKFDEPWKTATSSNSRVPPPPTSLASLGILDEPPPLPQGQPPRPPGPPTPVQVPGPFVKARVLSRSDERVDDNDDAEYEEHERRRHDKGRDVYRKRSSGGHSHRSSSGSRSGSRHRHHSSRYDYDDDNDELRRGQVNDDYYRERRRDRENEEYHGSISPRRSRSTSRDRKKFWEHPNTLAAESPSDLLVTHVNQDRDLQRLDDVKLAPQLNVDSAQWLENYSLDKMQLTLKDLLAKGSISKPVSDKSGKAIQQIKFQSSVVDEFEYKLNLALEIYSKRIKWLMQSSRKVFGLVQGQRVAVVVDSSNSNMSFGRVIELQDALINLIDEQLAKKRQMYFLTFGTDTTELWDNSLKDVNHRSIEEAKLFVTHMKPSGGCNVLRGLKRALSVKNIDTILLIIGSVPDQNMEILCDYISQATLDAKINFHCVSYEISNHIVNSALKNLANEMNGRYHCFSNSQDEVIYNSTDINLLLKEIQKAQDILNKIKEMRNGTLGSALIQIQNEISNELEKYPQGEFMPKPRGHDAPLKIEKMSTNLKSSFDWIDQNGLKAQKLNLYQVLAPNAYSYIEDYVPILKKVVQSQVHERVMVQFQWHDGSMKNIHVDLATLYDFQKRLKSAVELYEKRIDWLSTGSRKIFGALTENSVIILIDLSYKNQNYLIHIQHSLRLLLEQQIPSKKCFNLIGFGRTIKRWKQTVVKPTPALLQDAWKWVLQLRCEGTHNVLGALRAALENEEERKHYIAVEGLYVFTSGMPDQNIDSLCSYMEEKACGRLLRCHTILFNVDDYDINGPIPGRWANIKKTAEALRTLAHSVPGGRFHWFRETGIIESDDIRLLQKEIEQAVSFSKKAAALVDKIKRKDSKEVQDSDDDENDYNEDLKKPATKPILPPKQTALSMQRMALKEKEMSSESIKSLPWRPNSSKTEFVPLNQSKQSLNSSSSRLSKTRKTSVKMETFYIGDEDNAKGIAYRTSSAPSKPLQRTVPLVSISEKEENITTKDWLKKYSLVKLRLDLNKLAAGPECKHEKIPLDGTSIKKDSNGRYCSILPSINLNGTIRHLALKEHELKAYEEQCEKVLKRYMKRLQWLLSDSRRLFGTIVHDKCVILVDTSGSMSEHLAELKRELSCLVWEQLYKYRIKFNFIRFSDSCDKWQERIVEPTEENCHRAIAWLATLNAHGNTCTLDALREAFEDEEANSVYLITDGKPDTSTTLVLDEVQKMNSHRHLSINVVSFNCDEKSANEFLSQLAAENQGRYHRSSNSDRDIHLFVHKILTDGVHDNYMSQIPEFEGDDLRRLAKEINKARSYLNQAASFSTVFHGESFSSDLDMSSLNKTKSDNDKSALLPLEFLT